MANSKNFERKAHEILDEAAQAAAATTKAVKELSQTSARKIRDLAVDVKDAAVTRGPEVASKAAEVAENAAAVTTAAFARIGETAKDYIEKASAVLPVGATPGASDQPAIPESNVTTSKTSPKPEPEDLAALTVAQLRDRARAEGKSGYSRLNKAQLIALWD